MISIGISGICGRMGRRIAALAGEQDDIQVVLGLEREGHPQGGESVEGVCVTFDSRDIRKCECLIEFSLPAATVEHLPYAVDLRKCVVIGTTGFSPQELKQIEEASRLVPIVFSPNMSIGVNLIFRLIKDAAKTLRSYGVIIEEAHHVHKKDSPSGTAKQIARILRHEGFDIPDEDIIAIREDEIVGDHSVVFKSDTDEIEISHSAKSRDIFAQGALVAARWAAARKAPGLYSMEDVLSDI